MSSLFFGIFESAVFQKTELFEKLTGILSRLSYLYFSCLLKKQSVLHLAVFSVFCFFSTTNRTANTVQLFVTIKGNFFGLLFFLTGRKKGKSPETAR